MVAGAYVPLFLGTPVATILSFMRKVVNFGTNLPIPKREFILRLTLAVTQLISVYVYFARVLIAEEFGDCRLELRR